MIVSFRNPTLLVTWHRCTLYREGGKEVAEINGLHLALASDEKEEPYLKIIRLLTPERSCSVSASIKYLLLCFTWLIHYGEPISYMDISFLPCEIHLHIFFSNMRMQTYFQCHLCTTLCTSIIWLLVMGLDTAIYMWQDLPNAMKKFPRLCSCSHTSNMHLQMYSLMKQKPKDINNKEEDPTKDPIDGSKRNQQRTQSKRRWQMVHKHYLPHDVNPCTCLGIPYVPRSH
ncbi:hypothetical protein KP509_20G050600 [Ceratopteris richardii]|uniref:Uncharacterized protein n=1 Tax=Ceratopteris richardii TaxID=49495 RepID=A0A8T2SF71_CERRI|nr:hypothetical protein KP509_20G050600 [Ceratopteris richardii]